MADTKAIDHAWRRAFAADLAGVDAVGDAAHPGLPERPEVTAEKFRLSPGGCWVLDDGDGGVAGYGVSHPWRMFSVPPLDAFLGDLPADADCLYVHDIAVAHAARGAGMAPALMGLVAGHARSLGMAYVAGVAVNGSGALWSRLGFEAVSTAALRRSMASYGDGAEYMLARVDGNRITGLS